MFSSSTFALRATHRAWAGGGELGQTLERNLKGPGDLQSEAAGQWFCATSSKGGPRRRAPGAYLGVGFPRGHPGPGMSWVPLEVGLEGPAQVGLGSSPVSSCPAELPASPSEYASAAVQTVVGQVLQGIQLLPQEAQGPALGQVTTAFVEAWMDHILAQKIKFRFGA